MRLYESATLNRGVQVHQFTVHGMRVQRLFKGFKGGVQF